MSDTYKIQFNGRTLRFDNMPTTQAPVDLSIGKWTIATPLTIGIASNVLTNYGRGGWVELAYIPFKVVANGTYNITYDYFIENASCGNHGTYGFGIWFTENLPEQSSTYYNNVDNRTGDVLIAQNAQVQNKSGVVTFTVTLEADKTYYLWFPGGALNDTVPYRFTFTNMKCVPVSTDYVPSIEDGNIEFTAPEEKTGTYYKTLYVGNPSAAVASGTLNDSIANYDVIKFYGMPAIINASDASGTQQQAWAYPAYWLTSGNSAHMQLAGVISNTIINWSESIIYCPDNYSFAQARLGNAYRVASTANSTATWKYADSANWLNYLKSINKIEGIKYVGNRDLLFSSETGASAGTLSNGASNYDMLQVELSLGGDTGGIGGRYINEFKKTNDGSGRNTFAFPYGAGGSWYKAETVVRWTDDTHFNIPSAKSLAKNVANTANIAANTANNNNCRRCVRNIWGIRW